MNKSLLILLWLVPGLQLLSAQSTTISTVIPARYDRNALSIMLLENQSKYNSDLKVAAEQLVVPGKYDDHLLLQRTIVSGSATGELTNSISQSTIGNQVLAKWFSKKADGEFDMGLIGERGLYNATSDDFRKASASKIGMDKVKDAGAALVDNSYIQVLEFTKVQSMEEYYNETDAANRARAARDGTVFKPVDRTQNGYKAELKAHLFRIDPSYRDTLFNAMWIYADDPEHVKAYKRSLFNGYRFAFSYVMSTTTTSEAVQYNPGQLTAPKVQLSRQELFTNLINKAVELSLYGIESAYEPFRVKTALAEVRPLKAKIGTKEGLAVDQRFFVLENVLNASGETESKRMGVIYVSSVAENAVLANSSNIPLSRFYQTAGKKLDAGMTLQQRNDVGFGISMGGSAGGLNGFYLKAEQNLATLARIIPGISKNALKVTQLKMFFTYGLSAGSYDASTVYEDWTFQRMQLGVSKGFYFLRNFSVAPYVSFGTESAKSDNYADDYSVNTIFANAGAYLSVNILYNLQFIAAINVFGHIGSAYEKSGETSTDLPERYDYYFNGRTGPGIDFGIRYEL